MFNLVSPYLKMRCGPVSTLHIFFFGGGRGNPVVFVLLSRSQIELNTIFIVSKIA